MARTFLHQQRQRLWSWSLFFYTPPRSFAHQVLPRGGDSSTSRPFQTEPGLEPLIVRFLRVHYVPYHLRIGFPALFGLNYYFDEVFLFWPLSCPPHCQQFVVVSFWTASKPPFPRWPISAAILLQFFSLPPPWLALSPFLSKGKPADPRVGLPRLLAPLPPIWSCRRQSP
jgi:hypothetical protein